MCTGYESTARAAGLIDTAIEVRNSFYLKLMFVGEEREKDIM